MLNVILIFALVLNSYMAYKNASDGNMPMAFVSLIGVAFALFGLLI